jgi:hypothetical protein
MNPQQEQFLNLKTFPARVRVEEAALLLGFSTHEIPILAAHGLIRPLGHPPLTGVKFFSVTLLEELRRDEKWLARASDCIVEYWRGVNKKRKPARGEQIHAAPDGQSRLKRPSSISASHSAQHAETSQE